MPRNKRITTESYGALTRRYSYDPFTQNDFSETKESSHDLPELLTLQSGNDRFHSVLSTTTSKATRRTNLIKKHVTCTESFGNLPIFDSILGNGHSSEQVKSAAMPDAANSQEEINLVSPPFVKPSIVFPLFSESPTVSPLFAEPSLVSSAIYEPPFEIYSFKTINGNDSKYRKFSDTRNNKPKDTFTSFMSTNIPSNNLHQSFKWKYKDSFNRDLQHILQDKKYDQNNISNKFDANNLTITKNSINPIDQNMSHGLNDQATTTFRSYAVYEKHDVYCNETDNKREKMLDVVDYSIEDVVDKGKIHGSLRSLIKEELSLKIQCRRLSRGEPELTICPEQPKKYELTQYEIEKNVIRLHQNRQSAAKVRRLLRLREKMAEKVIQDELQMYWSKLADIATLKKQRDALKAIISAHNDSYSTCEVQPSLLPACTSTLFYGCEPWILTQALTAKLDKFARKCYQIMFGNCQTETHMTNTDLYRMADEHPVSETIREHRLQFNEHCFRIVSACQRMNQLTFCDLSEQDQDEPPRKSRPHISRTNIKIPEH